MPNAAACSKFLAQCAVAMLVLLARTARARLVAADLGSFADHRRGTRGYRGDTAATRTHGIGRGRLRGLGAEAGGFGVLEVHRARSALSQRLLLRFHRGDFFLAADA